MKEISTGIIPVFPSFYKVKDAPSEPDLKAICIFAAIGFFLDQDTYWKDEKVMRPGTITSLDDHGCLINSASRFEWYYQPRQISFEQALAEFTSLFEHIVKDQVQDSPVILPLSGGLDSRSQALALLRLRNEVSSYSYSFSGGYPESKIARKVAEVCKFPFKEFQIPAGYLWQELDELAQINKCFSEFTHPRQMAVLPELKNMHGIFSLGHWGDVLFDKGAPEDLTEKDEVSHLLKGVVKKSGMELAVSLWEAWGLEGRFEVYIKERISDLLSAIKIENSSARIRAFKSMYWAPRWTSTNLAIFASANPVSLPYYDDRMCEFICEIPEAYLANRRLQLAYIKQHKDLGKITWEAHKPFNLNNYPFNKVPYNLPYRVISKVQRESAALVGKKYIQRNWELQFLGSKNEQNLLNYLYEDSFKEFIPPTIVKEFYKKFKEEDGVQFSHSVSTLLTLSVWNKKFNHGTAN
ncbi:Asparagine synthase [Salinimicrobium sediminis]|uniref:asparagine synthase (glutamine-hydrolyzing) n=1 Tax=Salinimicrobium sediminis TaxID=1343891 RepID=A0A285WZL7_9FLAO|nr:asparagine synthase-related protein [Salinimicrobium sediminis]SOC78561.1 Asparagine synthase [Salinimicrobium sediminis]